MINNENIKRLFPGMVLVFGILVYMHSMPSMKAIAPVLSLIAAVLFWVCTNRKVIVAVKRKPQIIPLLALAGAFVYYSLNLTIVSNTTYNVNYPGMGLAGFAMMLLSALLLVCVLNAFPRRKKANVPMLVLTYVMIAVVIFSGVVYIDRIDDKVNNTYSAKYVDYLDNDSAAKKQMATVRQTVIDEMIEAEAPLSNYGFTIADQKTLDAVKADAAEVQAKAEEYAQRTVYTADGTILHAAEEVDFCQKYGILPEYQTAEALRNMMRETAAAKMPLGSYGFTTIDQQTLEAMKADAADVLAKAETYAQETVRTAEEAFELAATEAQFCEKYGIAPEFQAAEMLRALMNDVAAAELPLNAYGFTVIDQQMLDAMKADAADALAKAKQYEKELTYTSDEAFVQATTEVQFCEKYSIHLEAQSAENLRSLMNDVAAAELPLSDYGFTVMDQQTLDAIKADAADVLAKVEEYGQKQIYTEDGAFMLPARAVQFCEKYNVQMEFQTAEKLQELMNEALVAEMPLAVYGISTLSSQQLEAMQADAAAVKEAAKQYAKQKAYTADEALLQAANEVQFCEKYSIQAEFQTAEALRAMMNQLKTAEVPLNDYGFAVVDQQTLQAMKTDAADVLEKAEQYAQEKVRTAEEAFQQAANEVQFCEKYGINPEFQTAETLPNLMKEAAVAALPLSAYGFTVVDQQTLQAMQNDAAVVVANAAQYAQEKIYSADEALLISEKQLQFCDKYGIKPEYQTAEALRNVMADVAASRVPTPTVETLCERAKAADSGVAAKAQQSAATAADQAVAQYNTERPYVMQARKTLETHRIILLVGAALLVLLPVYAPLIRKINTSVEVEANTEMGELDLDDAE